MTSQSSAHHVPSADEAVKARQEHVEGHVGSHGHSLAAWAGVLVCLVGAAVAGIGIIIGWGALAVTIIGFALMVVSGPLTIILSRAGYGAAGPHPDAPDHAGRAVR